MDNRPIGIFDSGLGGLTAVQALRKLMPDENIIYFADSGRVPYGSKPVPQLRRMAVQDMDFVASHGAKAIIAACGTVSSNAADLLEAYHLPVFGVLKSSVEAMSRIPGDEPLGIIATAASIQSGSFQRALKELCPDREVIAAACPSFVTLIESGHSSRDDALVQAAIREYMQEMKDAGVKAVLLGCTHFGIIGDAIMDFMGQGTELVSASECAARRIRDYLVENDLCGGSAKERYFTSGPADEFTAAAATFLGRSIDSPAEHVPVMEV